MVLPLEFEANDSPSSVSLMFLVRIIKKNNKTFPKRQMVLPTDDHWALGVFGPPSGSLPNRRKKGENVLLLSPNGSRPIALGSRFAKVYVEPLECVCVFVFSASQQKLEKNLSRQSLVVSFSKKKKRLEQQMTPDEKRWWLPRYLFAECERYDVPSRRLNIKEEEEEALLGQAAWRHISYAVQHRDRTDAVVSSIMLWLFFVTVSSVQYLVRRHRLR
jgi:hypothetical protein